MNIKTAMCGGTQRKQRQENLQVKMGNILILRQLWIINQLSEKKNYKSRRGGAGEYVWSGLSESSPGGRRITFRFVFLQSRVSLCCPGYTRTHCEDQAGLKLKAFASMFWD